MATDFEEVVRGTLEGLPQDAVARTLATLAEHGIVSLDDLHEVSDVQYWQMSIPVGMANRLKRLCRSSAPCTEADSAAGSTAPLLPQSQDGGRMLRDLRLGLGLSPPGAMMRLPVPLLDSPRPALPVRAPQTLLFETEPPRSLPVPHNPLMPSRNCAELLKDRAGARAGDVVTVKGGGAAGWVADLGGSRQIILARATEGELWRWAGPPPLGPFETTQTYASFVRAVLPEHLEATKGPVRRTADRLLQSCSFPWACQTCIVAPHIR